MQYDLKTMKTTNNDLWHRSHWWHWRRTGWLWYQDTFTWRYWLHDWQCNQRWVVVLLNSTTSQNKQNITSQHYTNNPALNNFQYQSDRTIAICRVNPNPTENNYFAACEDLCQPKLHWSAVSLKHDGTDGPVKSVNTDGTAIERADGTANTGAVSYTHLTLPTTPYV